MKKLLFFGLFSSLFLVNCTEDDLPNPYDGVNYGDTPLVIDTVSDSSFVKIHRDILFPSCNNLGCHDGTIPPDFRTVESAYNTLVYHPIVKDNSEGTFTYRVVPEDTALSVLHERLTNCFFYQSDPDGCDRMPFGDGSPALPQSDIDKISAWIMEGAKGISGSVPVAPSNLQPWVRWFVVANAPTYDTIYGEWGSPRETSDSSFSIPSSQSVHFMFRVNDDLTDARHMEVNQLSLSEDIDFNNPMPPIPADFYDKLEVADFGGDSLNPAVKGRFWIASFNTNVLQSGTLYFMRYTFSDGEITVVFPDNESDNLDKINWSFTVQ